MEDIFIHSKNNFIEKSLSESRDWMISESQIIKNSIEILSQSLVSFFFIFKII